MYIVQQGAGLIIKSGDKPTNVVVAKPPVVAPKPVAKPVKPVVEEKK
jgi:hypothetical protein